eukprot:Hpha_TRINITY_DN34538_c0_g1::TRINITY_DN34538_c0_g1_i1::g.96367::m.96367
MSESGGSAQEAPPAAAAPDTTDDVVSPDEGASPEPEDTGTLTAPTPSGPSGSRPVDFATQRSPAGDTTDISDIDISRLSVGERLYYLGCGQERSKQERLRKERERQALLEMSQVTAAPVITQRAKQMPSKGVAFHEQSLEWRKRLDHNKRQQQAAQASDEVVEMCQTTLVTTRSENIISRLGSRYRGPITGWNRHFARYQTKKNTVPERELFAPNINITASIRRDPRPVGERLHEDANKREERLREASEVAVQQAVVDPVTMMPYFTPNRGRSSSRARSRTPAGPSRSATPGTSVVRDIMRRSASASPGSRRDLDAVVNGLLAKGQEATKKKEQMVEEAQRRTHTFRPAICGRSKDMTTPSRRPLYEAPPTPPIRATSPAQTSTGGIKFSGSGSKRSAPGRRDSRDEFRRDPRTPGFRDSREGPPGGFHRKVSPNRNAPRFENTAEREFLLRNEKLLLNRKERVEHLKTQIAKSETANCTFTPRICSRSDEIFVAGTVYLTPERSARGKSPGRSPLEGPSLQPPLSGGPAPNLPPPPPRPGQSPPPYSAAVLSPPSDSRLSPPRARHSDPSAFNEAEHFRSFEQEMMGVLDEWQRMEDL